MLLCNNFVDINVTVVEVGRRFGTWGSSVPNGSSGACRCRHHKKAARNKASWSLIFNVRQWSTKWAEKCAKSQHMQQAEPWHLLQMVDEAAFSSRIGEKTRGLLAYLYMSQINNFLLFNPHKKRQTYILYVDGRTDRSFHIFIYICLKKQTSGRTDRWTDGQTDTHVLCVYHVIDNCSKTMKYENAEQQLHQQPVIVHWKNNVLWFEEQFFIKRKKN